MQGPVDCVIQLRKCVKFLLYDKSLTRQEPSPGGRRVSQANRCQKLCDHLISEATPQLKIKLGQIVLDWGQNEGCQDDYKSEVKHPGRVWLVMVGYSQLANWAVMVYVGR